ncbi:MAG: DUF4278 domain-containing protein [Pleurocapsa sp.]
MRSKLRFLGQDYSPNNIFVETIPSDIMVCFRGQSYPLTRPLQSFDSKLEIRKYRGILYTKSF